MALPGAVGTARHWALSTSVTRPSCPSQVGTLGPRQVPHPDHTEVAELRARPQRPQPQSGGWLSQPTGPPPEGVPSMTYMHKHTPRGLTRVHVQTHLPASHVCTCSHTPWSQMCAHPKPHTYACAPPMVHVCACPVISCVFTHTPSLAHVYTCTYSVVSPTCLHTHPVPHPRALYTPTVSRTCTALSL